MTEIVENGEHVASRRYSDLPTRWFWDQEVFDFVAQRLHLIGQPSLRHYVAAWELKRAGLDWRSLVLSRCLSGKLLLVAQLKANPAYTNEKARSQAFSAAGGGCRATYFNLARQLRTTTSVPSIRLTTSRRVEETARGQDAPGTDHYGMMPQSRLPPRYC